MRRQRGRLAAYIDDRSPTDLLAKGEITPRLPYAFYPCWTCGTIYKTKSQLHFFCSTKCQLKNGGARQRVRPLLPFPQYDDVNETTS